MFLMTPDTMVMSILGGNDVKVSIDGDDVIIVSKSMSSDNDEIWYWYVFDATVHSSNAGGKRKSID